MRARRPVGLERLWVSYETLEFRICTTPVSLQLLLENLVCLAFVHGVVFRSRGWRG